MCIIFMLKYFLKNIVINYININENNVQVMLIENIFLVSIIKSF